MERKVLIFDMDGVLFDTIPYAEKVYLDNHPGMTTGMYRSLHMGNFHEETKKYAHLKKEETEEEKNNRNIAYAEAKSKTPMFDGVEELLKDLHNSGYLLVLNTNAYDKNCLPLLEKSGIKNLFDLIATAEFSKSKVEKFKLIEEKYNTTKDKILFITDSLGDVKEAQIAKVPTVAVTWGVHDRLFFDKEKYSNIIGIVNTVEELSQFIKILFMKNHSNNKLMMFSNIFLILPVIFAGFYHQWLYCFLASGLLVFSPLYHWYKINKPISFSFKLFKKLDWIFAISAFIYMYYYTYQNIEGYKQFLFYILLSLVLIFFWYGYKKNDYQKWHPWFHVVAPIISSSILIVAN